MSTRYGRRTADGTYEYHDSVASLDESVKREKSEFRAAIFGFIGLIVGGVLTYRGLSSLGLMDWPKWVRFILVILGAGVVAYALARLADLIWSIAVILLTLAVLWVIGVFVWDAI